MHFSKEISFDWNVYFSIKVRTYPIDFSIYIYYDLCSDEGDNVPLLVASHNFTLQPSLELKRWTTLITANLWTSYDWWEV